MSYIRHWNGTSNHIGNEMVGDQRQYRCKVTDQKGNAAYGTAARVNRIENKIHGAIKKWKNRKIKCLILLKGLHV